MSNARGDEIAERVCTLSAQIHAATAELVRLAAELDTDGRWAELGMRSCANWLSINAGFDTWTAGELVRVGHALEDLPRIGAAFADGRLSYDKVRAVVKVATPEDEPMWLDLAVQASGAQLARICLAVRRALDAAGGEGDEALARRSLRTWWRNNGDLELMAVLPREDGAAVIAAIEAAGSTIAAERKGMEHEDPATTAIGCLRQPALRADALVRVCEEWIAERASEPTPAPTRQVVIHVDTGVLGGHNPAGRCHIEDGPWLSNAAAQWLSCDADVVSILERGGLPIDVGRARRLVSPRQRLAMQARDRGCRYPGCSVPARRTEGHHVRHWPQGGRTDLVNLVSLCRFHHRRHHEGKFLVRRLRGGDFRFEAPDGTALLPVTPRHADATLTVSADVTNTPARALTRWRKL